MKTGIFAGSMLGLLFTIVSGVACSKNSSYGGGTGGGGGNPNTVYMKNMMFSNPSLQVVTGTKVTWINDDNTNHTVTSDTGLFDSGTISPGGSFNYTFNSTGTFDYHCIFHTGMTGKVIVVVY